MGSYFPARLTPGSDPSDPGRAGFSGESSVWFGALTGWIWMLEIEISDGLFADWGFSWLDLSANTLGAGFFVLQQYYRLWKNYFQGRFEIT